MNMLKNGILDVLIRKNSRLYSIVLFMFIVLLASPFCLAGNTFPDNSKVGYLENLNYNTQGERITPKFDLAHEHGYNVIVIAFADVKGTKVSFFDNNYNNKGYAPYDDKTSFLAGVDNFHKLSPEKNKVLVSLGGDAAGLWSPDENNVDELADNLIAFLVTNDLDGVDFDLEGHANAKTNFLSDLISKLREKAEKSQKDGKFKYGFYVTAAPQITGENGYFVWASSGDPVGSKITDLMKEKTFGTSCFDALLIQNYNPGVQPVNDALVGKIKSQGVPVDTKILIGMPAAPKAAPSGGYVDPVTLEAQLNSITDKQFGGLMLWTIAWDCGSDWQFSNGLQSNTQVIHHNL